MAWIAADDARCHDEALRITLTAIEASLTGAEVEHLRPASVVALVRAIAGHLRRHPSAGDRRVSAHGALLTAADRRVVPARAANARAAASALVVLG
ncbi:hypothetical protein [Microbacterium jejuense]|uniref:hypothetical protein n=1 Tax=Microbacterium jejuense TaxID=1263637 RepID=UPI0031F14663